MKTEEEFAWLIAKERVYSAKRDKQIERARKSIRDIINGLINISGPLNNNPDKFNKKQLKFLQKILNAAEFAAYTLEANPDNVYLSEED